VRATYLSLLGAPAAGRHVPHASGDVPRASAASVLSDEQRASVQYRFLLGAPTAEQAPALAAEQAEHGDLLTVDVPESYDTLFPKMVASWRWAISTHDFTFWMHADDDSFVRLDLLLEWLSKQSARGLYAGYMWDGSEGRRTRPIRDPAAKSHVPVEQWPHDTYPTFASGCGFVLSHDLVETLAASAASLTFCRNGDVPVGINLSRLPAEKMSVVHVDMIRPYRPLPLFRADTIVQHYMQPEEFKQFFTNAYGGVETDKADVEREQRIAAVYDLFVNAKVMRR